MASNTLTTFAKIVGVDQLSGPLAKMAGKVATIQGALQKTSNAARRFGNSIGGSNASLFGATAASAAFLRDQFELEKALNRSQAILEVTKDKFGPLMKEIERLGGVYPLTMRDAANASIEFGQAGLDAATQIAIFEQAVKGAMASGESVATVAGGVTDVVMGLGLAFKTSSEQAQSFRAINDLLVASANSANQSYTGFLAGFQKAAPIFKAVGMEAKEGAVLLGALANAGIKESRGGTALRTLLIRPLAATPKMLAVVKEALRGTGKELDSFYKKNQNINRTGQGLSQFMKNAIGVEAKHLIPELNKVLSDPRLKKSATEMSAALQNVFKVGDMAPEDAAKITRSISDFVTMGFNELDLTGLLKTLANTSAGPAVFKELFGLRHIEKAMALQSQLVDGQLEILRKKINEKLQYRDGEGPVDRFMKTMLQGFPGAVMKLNSAFDVLKRALGTSGALETIGDFFVDLKNATLNLSKTSPEMLKWATVTTVAVGALAPLGFVVMGITALLGPLAAGIGIAAGAAAKGAAAFAAYARHTARMSGVITRARGPLAAAAFTIKRALMFTGVGAAIGLVVTNLDKLWAFAKGFGERFRQLSLTPEIDNDGAIVGATGPLADLAKAWSELVGVFSPVGDAIKSVTDGVKELLGYNSEDNWLKVWLDAGKLSAEGLAGAIRGLAALVRQTANELNALFSFKADNKSWIGAAVAATQGDLSKLQSRLRETLSLITAPVGLVIDTDGANKGFQNLRATVQGVEDYLNSISVGDIFGGAFDAAKVAAQSLYDLIKGILDLIGTGAGNFLSGAFDLAQSAADKLYGTVKSISEFSLSKALGFSGTEVGRLEKLINDLKSAKIDPTTARRDVGKQDPAGLVTGLEGLETKLKSDLEAAGKATREFSVQVKSATDDLASAVKMKPIADDAKRKNDDRRKVDPERFREATMPPERTRTDALGGITVGALTGALVTAAGGPLTSALGAIVGAVGGLLTQGARHRAIVPSMRAYNNEFGGIAEAEARAKEAMQGFATVVLSATDDIASSVKMKPIADDAKRQPRAPKLPAMMPPAVKPKNIVGRVAVGGVAGGIAGAAGGPIAAAAGMIAGMVVGAVTHAMHGATQDRQRWHAYNNELSGVSEAAKRKQAPLNIVAPKMDLPKMAPGEPNVINNMTKPIEKTIERSETIKETVMPTVAPKAMEGTMMQAPEPLTREQAQGSRSVVIEGGTVNANATITEPLKLSGQMSVNVTGQVTGAQTKTSVSGTVRGPANAIPVQKSNSTRTGG